MKRFVIFLTVAVTAALLISSCTSKKEHEGRWRVIDEQVYDPDLDTKKVFTSLDELEKLIYAPFSYFRNSGDARTFLFDIKYRTEKQLENEKRSLVLEENVEYFSDDAGNYVMSFRNNRNEGYDFIWKDNFLYRRQLGGEFSKTFSMGEHRHYRETSFGSIPSIYSVLRNHAEIKNTKQKVHEGIKGTQVTIVFNEKPAKRKKLQEKRYLQNLFGTEEMKDDSIVKEFAESKKEKVNGSLVLFLDGEHNIIFMQIECGFHLVNEGVDFSVKGGRILSKKSAEENIEVPEYEEEYHRRTLDAAVNIMKDDKGKPKSEKQK
jgi:hypothetical protein